MSARRRTVLLAVLTATTAVAVCLPGSAQAATPRTRTVTAVSPARATAGARVTLTAKVSPTPKGGSVSFGTGHTTLCRKVAVRAGKARCRTTLHAGRRRVTARYSGTSAYRASHATRTVHVGAAPAITVVGGTGACTRSTGALVGVDFGHWNGPVVRGCGAASSTGRALLTDAGFTVDDVAAYHGFVCRLGNAAFAHGVPQPTASQACARVPSASASWSYWLAPKGATGWTYSLKGIDGDKPAAGEVEAWTFGSTHVGGSAKAPTFTPAQLRAGLPTAASADLRQAASGTSSADVGRGAQYLVDQLVDGTHYEQDGGVDLGLTVDGALALAAAGGHDATLAGIASYVAAHQNDYTLLRGPLAAYASGGAVGKVALLAEATGHDPRAFGGVDLVAALDRLVCTRADAARSCVAKGDYRSATSVFAQAYGILGQLRADDRTGAASPVAYLESLQTSSGGFASTIPSAGSGADTDSSAVAAMTLALVPGATARTAVGRALHWLAGRQAGNGGFPGTSGDSTNSAALAAAALHLDADTYRAQITKADRFLAGVQNGDGGFDIAAGIPGSDVRASAQAVQGAVGIPYASVLDHLPARSAAASGAAYLVGQLTGGDHYTSSYTSGGTTYTYDDQGLTADGLFALLAAGGHASTVAAMTTYLAGNVDAYADPTGGEGGPYSGALAKLALVAEATGGNPHSFGGTDLLGLVKAKVCTAAIAGDYSPCTAAGDLYNAYSGISQALGVLALQASPLAADHVTRTSPVVVRLGQLQCSDGGFSSTLIVPGGTCTSDVDTTGLAVQALAAVAGTDQQLARAQRYLQRTQRASGLYPGAAGDNSNSTALAAQGLQTLVTSLVSHTDPASGPKSVTPIVAWQSALTGLTGLSVSGGGFGVGDTSAADVRASTQAVTAAAQRTLLSLSGAPLRSAPRTAASSSSSGGSSGGSKGGSGSGSSGGSSGSGSGSDGSHAAAGAGSRPADTGVPAAGQLLWAVALLLAGAGLTVAGRRRTTGRHQACTH